MYLNEMPTAAEADPVGVIEIADRLGYPRATVAIWSSKKVLPPPRWTISRNPAWDFALDIEPWATRTGRVRTPKPVAAH